MTCAEKASAAFLCNRNVFCQNHHHRAVLTWHVYGPRGTYGASLRGKSVPSTISVFGEVESLKPLHGYQLPHTYVDAM